MTAAVRAAVVTFGTAILAGALVLLVASGFLSAWDGQVVSARPPRGDDPATVRVLIVGEHGRREADWPADVVRELDLPVDPLAIGPRTATGPRTVKRRFSLSYTVEGVAGEVGTTSPMAVGIAVLAALVVVAGRNMVVGGAPWTLVPRPRDPLGPLPPSGRPVAPKTSRPRAGPPPPRPAVGRGRR
jgi:hypothetical protein